MQMLEKGRARWKAAKDDAQFANDRRKTVSALKKLVIFLFRWTVIIGISYVIISPLIGIISSSFFSNSDKYSPMVYLIAQNPTLERYRLALTYLDYWKVLGSTLIYDMGLMLIQILICSMVGYGFARFQFPFKKLLFACVVLMIVLPMNTIMLPLYMTFRNFDILGIFNAVTGSAKNLLSTPAPVFIMTAFGCGLRSGLFIYIFNQFFRGLPKEIEEAAFVDGAGMWYTYFRIMLMNAMPSVVTVAIFSMVWQYNDTFYANLFHVGTDLVISKKISTLQATISNVEQIMDPTITQLYLYAGIVLVILPVILLYVLLQKQFIEGVERSGIVG